MLQKCYNHDMTNTAAENKNGFRDGGSGPDQWAATEWDKKDEAMNRTKEKEAVDRQWRCKAGCSHGTASSVVPWLQSAECRLWARWDVPQAGGASSLLKTAAMYMQGLRTRCAELRPSFHPLPTAQPASLNYHSYPHQQSVRPSVLSPDALTSTTCCSTTLPAMQVPLCAPLSAQSQNHVTLLCTDSRAASSMHVAQNRLPPMLLWIGKAWNAKSERTCSGELPISEIASVCWKNLRIRQPIFLIKAIVRCGWVWSIAGNTLTAKDRSTHRKPVPLQLCPPQT